MDIIEGEDCIRREKILAVEMSSKEGEEEEEEEKEDKNPREERENRGR